MLTREEEVEYESKVEAIPKVEDRVAVVCRKRAAIKRLQLVALLLSKVTR